MIIEIIHLGSIFCNVLLEKNWIIFVCLFFLFSMLKKEVCI